MILGSAVISYSVSSIRYSSIGIIPRERGNVK